MGHLTIETLTSAELAGINTVVFKILLEIGMIVEDRQTAKRLVQSGCIRSVEGRILFPIDVVHRALSTVPDKVSIYDREGRISVSNRGRRCLSIGLNCVNMYDRKLQKQRPGLLEDVKDAALLCEKLPGIDMAAALCTPSDVLPENQAYKAAVAVTSETGKPLAFTAHDEIESAKIWEHLACEAGGWTKFSSKPTGLDLTGPTSPLFIGTEAIKRLRFASSRNLPVVCYPGIIPGAASPVTLSGAIAQSSAEVLAGIVIHQLENPGAPVLSGSAVLPMDMRRGLITYGSPEYSLACSAAVDYFNMLGVPSWIGGGCSDAHVPGSQAAAEALMTMNMAMLSGTSFIHNAGYLSSGKTGSLEMIVFADELMRISGRLARGIDCSEEAIGFDLIKSASVDGNYMGTKHTIQRMRSEMFIPAFFPRSDEENGADIWKLVNEKLNTIL